MVDCVHDGFLRAAARIIAAVAVLVFGELCPVAASLIKPVTAECDLRGV